MLPEPKPVIVGDHANATFVDSLVGTVQQHRAARGIDPGTILDWVADGLSGLGCSQIDPGDRKKLEDRLRSTVPSVEAVGLLRRALEDPAEFWDKWYRPGKGYGRALDAGPAEAVDEDDSAEMVADIERLLADERALYGPYLNDVREFIDAKRAAERSLSVA